MGFRQRVLRFGRAVTVLWLLGAAGCTDPPVVFPTHTPVARDGAGDSAERLAVAFGTPDLPRVPVSLPLDEHLVAQAAGPVENVNLSHRRGLYRQHCASCHGVGGLGNGPAAGVLSTEPRNFAIGHFKYRQIPGAGLPTRADLRSVIELGVSGTAMPSFALLPEAERNALVEYVRYLAMRGMAELQVSAGNGTELDAILKSIGEQWRAADPEVTPPISEST